ncbi:MAG: ribonuclease P protein component [Nevskiales bacterium]|nr:ribonuclease P protein component [Nevskiales bacterium]
MARFSRRARLLKPGEFRAAFKQGKRIHGRWLTAVAVPNALDYPRLGLAIAKKSVAKATQRNILKRQIRATFREAQPCLRPVDVVILAKPGAAQATRQEIRANLDQIWRRLGASSADSSSASSASTNT